MKKIERKQRGGKTYRCMKRAYKLFKRGKNVLYITPYGMNHAHELSQYFVCCWVKKHKLSYGYFPHKCNCVENTHKKNFIKFVSWEYYHEHTGEEFYDHSLNIIFDDIHILFVGTLDTVSVTKGF